MRAVFTPGRTLRQMTVLTAVVASCALGAASTAGAHGTRFPVHVLQATYCYDWGFEVSPPRFMSSLSGGEHISTMETVWWSVDILRWNARQGRWKAKVIGEWYYAFATGRGLVPDTITGSSWHDSETGQPLFRRDYTVRGHGRYKIKHWFQWYELENTDFQHKQVEGTCRK